MIDVYDRQNERFMDYERAKDFVTETSLQGIEFLERMDEGFFTFEALARWCKEIYGKRDDFEGVLVKNYEKILFKMIAVEQKDRNML